jgi:hypothetical protein
MTRLQIEAIVRALKVTPPNPDEVPESSLDRENLRYLTGALEDTLQADEDDGTLHGICL